MDIKIFPVDEADRAFFVFVHHEAYRETIESQFGSWDEQLQDKFANKAFDMGGMNILEIDGEKIGVVGWDNFPEYLWLKELFILPQFQNKGIGTKVLNIVKEEALKQGKLEMRLQTLKANLNAKRLYEKNGFQVLEKTDTHWQMVRKF